MRKNIVRLVKIIEQFNTSSSIGQLVVDIDFESRLKELTSAVNKLLDKAEKSNSTDRLLQQQLELLDQRVGKITQVLSDAWNSTSSTSIVVENAVSNISEAEASINRSRILLDEAEKLLLMEGLVALNESMHAANSSSEQATRMIEIRNEVLFSINASCTQMLFWLTTTCFRTNKFLRACPHAYALSIVFI